MKRIGLIGLGEMGTGQLASSYEPTAKALKEDGYEGVISLESVYCPEGCTFEDGQLHLYNLKNDIGEKTDLAETQPERIAKMQNVLETFIHNGRSTPGLAQKNDVKVIRYPK